MTWLTGWDYRQSFTVSRSVGAVTNYQMKLLVGESAGSSGPNVHCNGLCASDFDDIRFTTVNGTTLLDYWIESTTGITPNQVATIWIEFDSIATIATTFYMYYGNISATATSSGVDTFPLFDDFNDGSIDTSKWTDMGGTVEAGGELTATATSTAAYGVASKTFFGVNYAIRCRIKPTHVGGTTYLESCSLYDASNNQQVAVYFCQVSSTFSQKCTNLVVSYTNADLTGVAAGVYCIVDICRNSTTDVKYLVDNNPIATIATNVPTGSNHGARIQAYANGATITTDWVLIRQWNVTEPSWGAWGAQESINAPSWLSGWNYRKLFYLSRSSGGIATNVQVKILVGESVNASGFTVHCGGLCLSNFADIRFTNVDGTTLLDYWVESITGVTPNQLATIWVKTDSINTGVTSFYLYYGNAEASSESNATDVFLFFEDFNSLAAGNLNGQNNWSGSTSYQVQNSVVKEGAYAVSVGNVSNQNIDHAITVPSFNVWVELYVRAGHAGDTTPIQFYLYETATQITGAGISADYIQHLRASAWENVKAASDNTWYKVRIAIDALNTHKIWVDDVLQSLSNSSNINNVVSTINDIKLARWTATANTVYFDQIKVGKYSVADPMFVGAGDQEPTSEISWIAGWSKRLPLTLEGSNIIEAATDFPLMIYLDSTCSGIFNELGDNDKKISLRLEDNTECYVEIESWDSNTMKAVLWTKIPSLIAYNNVNMYLYYDNDHADNTTYVGLTGETAAKAVWESSYKCVLHFAQTPAGAGSVKDSTTNANHGTPGATATLVDGEFGKAYDFDGSTTGYVRVTDHASLDFTTAMTMIGFYNSDVSDNIGDIVSKNTTGNTYAYGLCGQNATKSIAWAGKTGGWVPTFLIYDDVAPIAGAWTMLAGVYNGTNLKCYNNGVYKSVSGDSAGSLYNSAGDLWVGYNSEFSRKVDGKIAFVSLAAAVRTEAYLLLTYKSLRNQLITVGAEETAPGPSLVNKLLKLSILNTNVSANLTNFPVLVHLSSDCGANSFNALDVFYTLESDTNRKKFVITTVSGNFAAENQCAVEIERWDNENSEAWLWVKVPTVSSGAATPLYMYYGLAMDDNTLYVGDTNSVAARNVWDSHYIAVYHLGQDPSGGAQCITDSTSNVRHGTPDTTMTSVDLINAEIGKGLDFDGSDDYISFGANPIIGSAAHSIEAFMKNGGHSTYGLGVLVGSAEVTRKGAYIGWNSASAALGGGYYGMNYATGFTDTAWHYVAMTYAGGSNGNVKFYGDNAVVASGNTTPDLASSVIYIGKQNTGVAYIWKGDIDEVRISDVERSPEWMKATYYSNIDNLIEFGPIEDYSHYYFSGAVSEDGSPVDRSIYAYRRDTGELIGLTTSVSGVFYLTTTYSGSHFLICLDELNYNLLGYDLMTPIIIS